MPKAIFENAKGFDFNMHSLAGHPSHASLCMMSKTPAAEEGAGYTGVFGDPNWWLFCFLILALNFVLLALDPLPKLFMGDSAAYLHIALTGRAPIDRSFLYGYVIRWSSVWTQSLTSLLILQAFLGAITAILIPIVCRSIFGLASRPSYLFGLLCSLDPLQSVWQRYVMTETVSLFFYVLMLLFSFLYLKHRRLWQLALVQILAVFVISFRMSYLLVVQISAIFLPLIAFFPEIRTALRTHSFMSKMSELKSAAVHLVFSILLMFVLQQGYRDVNGRLAGRKPAYLHASGFSVLTTWAPVLKPTDSPDPRLSELIAEGSQFQLNNIRARDAQLYSPGHLIARWKQIEPNFAIANQVAEQTALHAVLHRPLDVAMLGVKTFLDYWDFARIHRQVNIELGKAHRPNNWPDTMTSALAAHFRLSSPTPEDTKTYTLLQRYYLRAQPYYYVVLLSPFVCCGLIFFVSEGYVSLLFLHTWILLGTATILSKAASVRYLQPMSLLTILIFAVLVKVVIDRRSPATSARRPEHLHFGRRRSCEEPRTSSTTQG
jgi:hypothetical protein